MDKDLEKYKDDLIILNKNFVDLYNLIVEYRNGQYIEYARREIEGILLFIYDLLHDVTLDPPKVAFTIIGRKFNYILNSLYSRDEFYVSDANARNKYEQILDTIKRILNKHVDLDSIR